MSDLKIRRIPFDFKGVDFIWNPDHPSFSIAMNKFSFFAIGFEKYICQAVQNAEALIKDPALLEEAKAFCAQEGVHSRAHRKHVRVLIERYPGLQETLDKVIKSYDDLFASKDLKYHLAYVGGLESTFTPSMKLLIDNRETLLEKGDARVASMLLWHFCEEIEHRSAALAIYNHIFGDYIFRARNFLQFFVHIMDLFKMMDGEFMKHVHDVPMDFYSKKYQRPLPRIGRAKSIYGIVMSQMPWHNPEHQVVPEYFHHWMAQFDAGEDMRQTYGLRAQELPAATKAQSSELQ